MWRHPVIKSLWKLHFINTWLIFTFQPYLNVCGITKIRYYLTRLRVPSHRLYIESGRWAKPNPVPVEDRQCNICNTLEDEYHFLLECSLYTNLRCQYIPRYFRFRPNMQTLIELITNENSVIIKHLGIYVCKAFELNHSNRY